VDGIANSRLLLLLGVLQKRCGVFLSRQDVYVNVVGRMRLDRGGGNAADLAVAVALVSSLSSIAVRSDTAFVGEIGLLGELRSVAALDKRIQEARRMGFQRIITSLENPKARRGTGRTHSSGIEWVQCSSLMEAINAGLVQSLPRRGRRRSKEGNDAPSSSEQLEIIDDEDDEYDAFM
jgi:DNA repair protein RadA/Sms